MAIKGDLLLEMNKVQKRFGGAVALRGTDLKIRAGEIHALLGENKTDSEPSIEISKIGNAFSYKQEEHIQVKCILKRSNQTNRTQAIYK